MGGDILTRQQVLAAIDEHAEELQRLGAKSLAVFGSVSRGEAAPSSDVDILVDLRAKTFDAYMDVKLCLERILDRRVDLVLIDAIKPSLRTGILREAVHASRL